MDFLMRQTFELTQPADSYRLESMLKSPYLKKLIINYEYDPTLSREDYLNSIDADGVVGDCEEPMIKPFVSPFADLKLKEITVPIEIGPKCTSIRGLFAGQKKLKSIQSISGTDHVRNFNYAFSDCFNLTEIPKLNLLNAISTVGMCSGCHRLENLELTGGDNVENASGMFEYCYHMIKAPEMFFPNCKIVSGMFDSCFNLKKVPTYLLPAVQDCACMFQDCIRLKYAPNLQMPKAVNFIQIFSNCRSLANIPSFIFNVGRNNTSTLMLCAFDGCGNLDKSDIRFLLRNCPDALLEWDDAVMNHADVIQAIHEMKKNRKHENHHWLSHIVIFTLLLLASAILSIQHWEKSNTKGISATTDNIIKNNIIPAQICNDNECQNEAVISQDTAKKNAADMDVDNIVENYTERCPDEHITFERYTDEILLKAVNQIGIYQSKLYRLNDNADSPYILIIANKTASYISEPLTLAENRHKVVMMRSFDPNTTDTTMLQHPVSGEELAGLAPKLKLIQPAINDTDLFINNQNDIYTLTHIKYKKVPVDLSDKIFYQYAIPILLKENNTGRFLIPMPLDGHYHYLDAHNQISEEILPGCFEIQAVVYDGLQHGLTYQQANGLSAN